MTKRQEESILLRQLKYFLDTYMTEVRGLSRNTVISYRTTFVLLICFMYTVKEISADKITFKDLDTNTLSDFMSWLEKERGCSASTKNQRLAALYSFSEFAQNRDFDAAAVFRSAVLRIPTKKTPRRKRIGFTVEEVKLLLAAPGQNSEIALRDTVLLSLMYATGARAQEICDLTVSKVQFRQQNTTVDIVGKGSKARRVRIPDHCAAMLRKYLIHRGTSTKPERHIFSSQTHEHMTVSCVEEIYKKYLKQLKGTHPDLFVEERYSPHSMRHTTGQHMLEAGVPLMVIKSFLGHASVQTTQIYAESSQATVDRHVKEWNERNFPNTLYTRHNEIEDNIPEFLKGQ